MTKGASKKHQGKLRDRLSELPDDILVHILTFLPVRHAVRTVLLRRFGKLWTLLPSLNFDANLEVEFICNVLNYHKNPTIDMLEFSLGFLECDNTDEYLKNWTNFALRKQTKALSVSLQSEPSYLFVPPRVFRNQSLVNLELFGLEIKLPHRVFMGSLRKLDLSYVMITDEMFQKLISGCPCLQELIVMQPDVSDQLHITAPSIEKLELNFSVDFPEDEYSLDCPNLKILYIDNVLIENLKVIDVSSVREANIYCWTNSIVEEAKIVDDYFELLVKKFRNAQVFQLRNKTYLQLQPCGSMKWDFQKNIWRDLAVSSGIHGSCVLGLCRLLRNARYLENLVIYADVEFCCDCNMLPPKFSSSCFGMRKLTTITVRDCAKPCQGLLLLIKFLLKSAVVLEQLVIICNKDQLFSLEGRPFIMELLSFPRASQNARVVIA